MKNVLKFIGALLWQLPQSIIGWSMMLFFVIFGKVRLITKYKQCYIFEADLMQGAISLGTVIICSTYSAKNVATIQHEIGHMERSRKISWLYLFVIGIPSICWAALYRKLGYKNYYVFFTESWANKLAGLEAYEYYPGYYKTRFIKK